jgi:hypothetical protein
MTVFQMKVLNAVGICKEKSNESGLNVENKGTRRKQNEFTKRKQSREKRSSPILLYT